VRYAGKRRRRPAERRLSGKGRSALRQRRARARAGDRALHARPRSDLGINCRLVDLRETARVAAARVWRGQIAALGDGVARARKAGRARLRAGRIGLKAIVANHVQHGHVVDDIVLLAAKDAAARGVLIPAEKKLA
jgi:hypothetical protein